MVLKTCIWCLDKEPTASFNRKAHIFPQSLGGERLCSAVCDKCNLYFGSKLAGLPSVEIALKEPLNISRLYLLSQEKNKSLPRFKSEYFEYDFRKQLIKPKFKYRTLTEFQRGFTKQFRRGIYKVFLEERQESVGDALESNYNFIRAFARYGIGDLPVYYCRPRIPAVFMSDDVGKPLLRFTLQSAIEMSNFGFYSYYFITHYLAFPVIQHYEITLENYIKWFAVTNNKLCSDLVPITKITDIDFMFLYTLGNRRVKY